MHRGVKILLAASVLLTGTSLAMLFRRPSADACRPAPPSSDPLVFREQIGPQTATVVPERPTVRIESRAAAPEILTSQLPTVLKPLDPGQPPPVLAKMYPGESPESEGPWETSGRSEYSPWQPLNSPPAKHKIVDGDTLPALAERYLGDGSRWNEIFQANQNALSSPQLLPIGAVLAIPSADSTPPASSNTQLDKRLIPLLPRDAAAGAASGPG